MRAPEPAQLLVLGRYSLGRRLGSGAFGTVHAGRDERLERDVAIKVLPRERVVGGRFEREARAAARLAHPAIVTLYEAAIDDHGAYLVSELVRGRTLDELLEGGRLSDRDILSIAIALCDALAHAHEQGVVHRDVKPSNVLVPARSGATGAAAKLTDFGVAHVVGGDSLTRTGDVIGTIAYMAPEQAEGRPVGPAADLYSLAVVIYEALTGTNPLRQLRGGRPRRLGAYLPPLRRQRRDLPRALGIAIDQALRPRPGERGTVGELRAALVESLEEVGVQPGVVAPGWRGQEEPSEDGPEAQWRDDTAVKARAAGPQVGGTVDSAASLGPGLRAVAAVCAALVAAWVGGRLLAGAPLAPAAVALAAAVAVLLSPRAGWVVSVIVLGGAAALQGHAGAALELLLAGGLSSAILLFCMRAWALPAGAAVLAVAGLAGAWPAVLCRAGLRWWQRGALAGAGYVWIAAATLLAEPHPPVILHDAIASLLTSRLAGGALVCAAAATVLPWVAKGGHPVRSVISVTVWAALTVSALQTAGIRNLHGLVLGAVAGGLIVLAPAFLQLARQLRGGTGLRPRLP